MSFAGIAVTNITTQAVAVMPAMQAASIDVGPLATSINDAADMLYGNGQITSEEFDAIKAAIGPFVPT